MTYSKPELLPVQTAINAICAVPKEIMPLGDSDGQTFTVSSAYDVDE